MSEGQEMPVQQQETSPEAGAALSEYQQGLLKRYHAGDPLSSKEKRDLIGDPTKVIATLKRKQAHKTIFLNAGKKANEIMNMQDLSLAAKVSLSKTYSTQTLKDFSSGYHEKIQKPEYWDPSSELYGKAAQVYYDDNYGKIRTDADMSAFRTNWNSLNKQQASVAKQHGAITKKQHENLANFRSASDKNFAISQGLYVFIREGLSKDENKSAKGHVAAIEKELNNDMGDTNERGESTGENILSGSLEVIETNLEALKQYIQLPLGSGYFNQDGYYISFGGAGQNDPTKKLFWYNRIMKDIIKNRNLLRKVKFPKAGEEEENQDPLNLGN